MNLAYELETLIKSLNPYAFVPGFFKNYVQKDLHQVMQESGISEETFLEVIKWAAANSEEFKVGLMGEKPHWFIQKNWNKISKAFHQKHFESSEEPSITYRSISGADIDMIRKGQMPIARAKEICDHARIMVGTAGPHMEAFYKAIISLADNGNLIYKEPPADKQE